MRSSEESETAKQRDEQLHRTEAHNPEKDQTGTCQNDQKLELIFETIAESEKKRENEIDWKRDVMKKECANEQCAF